MTKTVFKNIEEMEEYYMIRERFILNRVKEAMKRLFTVRLYSELLLYSPFVKNDPKRMEANQKTCQMYSKWAYDLLEELIPMILDNSDEAKRGFIEYCEAKKEYEAPNNQ